MTVHIIFILVISLLTIVSIFCFGYLEVRKSSSSDSKKQRVIKEVVLSGVAKLLSTVGVALLSAGVIAMVLSQIIKPTPEIVMPAYASSNSYYDWNTVSVVEVETIISESEARITVAPEIAYSDMAHAYFMSRNYDMAIPILENAYAINQSWEYANDIGICYGYLCDYEQSLRYLNLAVSLNPPIVERGAIVEAKTMIESYFSSWLPSLFR